MLSTGRVSQVQGSCRRIQAQACIDSLGLIEKLLRAELESRYCFQIWVLKFQDPGPKKRTPRRFIHIWHSPGHPHPPPPGDGHGSLPRPLWEWVGWLWMGGMLVDGVVVFANDVESYGICKELYLVRERRQTWKAHSLMMGQ